MGQRGYKQLTDRDRVLIALLKRKKLSLSEIARRLGKNKSTISRELRRNAIKITPQDRFFYLRVDRFWTEEQLDEWLKLQAPEARKSYVVWSRQDAQAAFEIRAWKAQQKRRRKQPATRKWVVEKLHLGWSPQQIAGRSKLDGPESVSHEYVYDLVHRDKKRGGGLYRLLKRFGRRKQRFGERAYPPPAVDDRISIDKRPLVVAKRSRLGDHEADLIVGHKQSGYVLSVIDRKSRAAILRRVGSKRMEEVRAELETALKQLRVARTLTVDNGKEFYAHKKLAKNTGVRVFFTHPYCSTERGSVENFNGLVRHFLRKGSSFARVTQKRLDDITNLLNHRPRKCLGYLTPHEVHFKKISLRTLTKRCT
jgi:IS30 family transposase